MQITHFERDGLFSIGFASGEGLHFRFSAANATGRIEILQEKIDGEWLTVPGPAPLFLQTLMAVAMADASWREGEVEVPMVAIGAEPW